MLNKKLVLVSLIVAYIAYRFTFGASKPPPKIYGNTVETSNGKIRGIISLSRDGHEFYEYLGIPYAKARRFEVPQPAESWTGLRDGSEYGAKCLQLGMLIGNVDGEEDCLFLNVFVPKDKPKGSTTSLPVLVYIHGGHFTEGASNSHLPTFLIDQDLVLVTINYRLGVLGFLNTGDGLVRGNMGLKDQSMALRWVQKNIANFGGDPKQVILLGESAGGVSVHYQVLSPMSKGLFHKAISMSGTSLKPWALMTTPKEQALRFGKRVGCPIGTTKELVECLKSKDGQELMAAQSDILEYPRNPLAIFVPSIESVVDENTFLSESPRELLASGKFSRVPFLTGVNKDEGLISSTFMVGRVGALELNEAQTETVFPLILYTKPNGEKIRLIREQYFGKDVRIDSFDHLDNYTRLLSDRHFFTGFEQTVKAQSQHTNVFAYYYTYKTEFTLAPIFLAVKGRFPLLELITHMAWSGFKKDVLGFPPEHYGICHADELALFFHLPGLTNVHAEHQDYAFSKKTLKLWRDFIHDEHSMEFMGTKWSPVKANDPHFKYLHIDEDSAGLVIPPFRERLKFWEQLNL